MTVITDASMSGWGGHRGEQVVWVTWDVTYHLAYCRHSSEVLTDNTTAVSYINKEGGTQT
jgi:hypothetical protein